MNATVNLTLDELDKLRGSVKEKDEKLLEKDHHISKLAQEVAKIKSEQPKVTVTINQITNYIELQRVIEPYKYPGSSYGGYVYDNPYSNLPSSMTKVQFPPVPKYNEIRKQHIETSVEYLNLEDVKDELRKDIETRYGDELISLRNKLTSLTKERIDYEAAAYKEKTQLTKDYEALLSSLNEQHSVSLNILRNKIKELREEEVQKTKDQLILDLQTELKKLKNRSLIERLIN